MMKHHFRKARITLGSGFAVAAIILACAMPMPARADLSAQMDSMFTDMVTITKPHFSMGPRRGLMSAGGVSIKNDIVTLNPFDFALPSASAGCAGINLFMGSFSFISMDQFVQSLRAIASNAAGYAFKIAMSAMCPTCSSIMANLRRIMNGLNSLANNSCRAAQRLVNSIAGYVPKAFKSGAEIAINSVAEPLALATDALANMFPATNKKNDAAQATGDKSMMKKVRKWGGQGNLIWKALVSSDVKSWFTYGDQKMLEAIMSLTGSVIVSLRKKDPNPKTNSDPDEKTHVQFLDASLDFKDFLFGAKNKDVKIYNCGYNTGKDLPNHPAFPRCMNPETMKRSFKGFVPRVRKLLTGIVEAFGSSTQTLTNKEKAFLAKAPNSIGTMIRNLSTRSKGAAMTLAYNAAPAIAHIMAADFVFSMIEAARTATKHLKSANVDKLVNHINEVAKRIRQVAELTQAQIQGLAALVGTYRGLSESTEHNKPTVGGILSAIGF